MEAGSQRQRFDRVQLGGGVIARLQVVIWDARHDVMQEVQADAAGHPLQHRRQTILGTSVQRGLHGIPVGMARPVDALELMLHVEQPDAD